MGICMQVIKIEGSFDDDMEIESLCHLSELDEGVVFLNNLNLQSNNGMIVVDQSIYVTS